MTAERLFPLSPEQIETMIATRREIMAAVAPFCHWSEFQPDGATREARRQSLTAELEIVRFQHWNDYRPPTANLRELPLAIDESADL